MHEVFGVAVCKPHAMTGRAGGAVFSLPGQTAAQRRASQQHVPAAHGPCLQLCAQVRAGRSCRRQRRCAAAAPACARWRRCPSAAGICCWLPRMLRGHLGRAHHYPPSMTYLGIGFKNPKSLCDPWSACACMRGRQDASGVRAQALHVLAGEPGQATHGLMCLRALSLASECCFTCPGGRCGRCICCKDSLRALECHG